MNEELGVSLLLSLLCPLTDKLSLPLSSPASLSGHHDEELKLLLQEARSANILSHFLYVLCLFLFLFPLSLSSLSLFLVCVYLYMSRNNACVCQVTINEELKYY